MDCMARQLRIILPWLKNRTSIIEGNGDLTVVFCFFDFFIVEWNECCKAVTCEVLERETQNWDTSICGSAF